jgi:aspartokinase-like uncharacterized kinase
MSSLAGAVVKVGGSLLELDDLVPLLHGWLARQKPQPAVYIAGGGPWADAIRAAAHRYRLSQRAAHWLSIDAMGVTARLLAELFSSASLTRDLNEVRQASGKPMILDVEHFLRHEEPSMGGTPLPGSWHVTSDSIAARVALALGARELILLKSALPGCAATLQQMADQGYVDGFFPTAAASIATVRFVNLRGHDAPEVRLERDEGRKGPKGRKGRSAKQDPKTR